MSEESPLTLRDVLALNARDDQWNRFRRAKPMSDAEIAACTSIPFCNPMSFLQYIDTEEEARYRFADAFLKARASTAEAKQ